MCSFAMDTSCSAEMVGHAEFGRDGWGEEGEGGRHLCKTQVADFFESQSLISCISGMPGHALGLTLVAGRLV